MSRFVIDTSAILCVIFSEAEAPKISHRLVNASEMYISAGTLAEVMLVSMTRNITDASKAILKGAGIQTVPVTEQHVRWHTHAFQTYGKGRHSAGLNYGDCFAYACTKVLDVPLLYVGDEFAQTDIAFEA